MPLLVFAVRAQCANRARAGRPGRPGRPGRLPLRPPKRPGRARPVVAPVSTHGQAVPLTRTAEGTPCAR